MNPEAISLRSQLAKLENDISIHYAQQDFASHISKINDSIENPNFVNDEINYQKENFSKLKFQYLEQETKEKFLRSLFDNHHLSVQQEDINKLQLENEKSKKELKILKESMGKKMNDVHEISRETAQLNDEYQHKYNETNEILENVEKIEDKINSIIDNQREERKEIIKCLIDISSDINEKDLTKIMTNVNNKEIQVDPVSQASNELHMKTLLNENQQQHLQKLQDKLITLKSNLMNMKNNEEPNENQFFAQWVKEMNEILLNLNGLSNIRFEFEDHVDLKLFVKDQKIVISKDFDILNGCELPMFADIIHKVNSHEDKMNNFLTLVNRLLQLY